MCHITKSFPSFFEKSFPVIPFIYNGVKSEPYQNIRCVPIQLQKNANASQPYSKRFQNFWKIEKNSYPISHILRNLCLWHYPAHNNLVIVMTLCSDSRGTADPLGLGYRTISAV